MEKYILLLAAGKSTRFNTDLPKQFMPINDRPLLLHTFDAFLKTNNHYHFVLVLSESIVEYWHELCIRYRFKTTHQVVVGGTTRFLSVKNGLGHIPDNALVAIHDGVRPIVSKQLIKEGFALAQKYGNAIPVVKITDSVRQANKAGSKPVNRNNLVLVQTPQFFNSSLIKTAYKNTAHTGFTDDATMFEETGNIPYLFQGERKNIKVTHPGDLDVVKAFL